MSPEPEAPRPDAAVLRISPPLDPAFRPSGRARRALEERIRASGLAIPVTLAVEQPGGTVSRHETVAWPDGHPEAALGDHHAERLLKTLLWTRGGSRVHVDGPDRLVGHLRRHFAEEPTGIFDARIAAEIYLRPLELVRTPAAEMPSSGGATVALGGHLDGCRIGFDLGASDRKVAAVIDGKVVFSEEVPWDPASHADPQWHYDGIDDSLRRAAAHLPRVDAIGGSAAGVYVDSQVRVASLFRSVPRDLFETRVRGLFVELRAGVGRRPVRGRQRRRGDRPGRLDDDGRRRLARDRARLQPGRRLRHARADPHDVAGRAGLRPDRLSRPTPRSTSGPATAAAASSTSPSRRWAGCSARPGSWSTLTRRSPSGLSTSRR